jgi:putative Ca2+/H+ antiporter (TMEM165/GDT1 family)
VGAAIFIAELTDKDALLLLSLATRFKAWVVFAAGSVAFTITSAIIVTLGHFLVSYVPVSWISLAGGTIMICYGVWSFFHEKAEEEDLAGIEKKLAAKASKGMVPVFLSAVGLLMLLDLAGDATEVLTILFVARFDAFMVFIGAVVALVAATAVETMIGNRLSKVLSAKRIRLFSLLVFLVIGTTAILSVALHV